MGTRTTRMKRTNTESYFPSVCKSFFIRVRPLHPRRPRTHSPLIYHFPALRLHLFVSFVQYLIFSFYICAV